MRNTGRARCDGNQLGLAAGVCGVGLVVLLQFARRVRGAAQEALRIEQCLGWGRLRDALADEALQRQWAGFHHDHQIGTGDLCRRQRRANGLGIVDFHCSRPAQAMSSRFE